MANIQPEITAFKTAAYGEDVRDSMISLANKINSDSEQAASIADNYDSRLTALETVIEGNTIINRIDNASSRLDAIDDLTFSMNDLLVQSIDFTKTPWKYGTSADNKTLSPPEGVLFHLYDGDEIGLFDFSEAHIYVGWIIGGQLYDSGEWLDTPFMVTRTITNPDGNTNNIGEGQYTFIVRYKDNRVISNNPSDLSKLIYIRRANNPINTNLLKQYKPILHDEDWRHIRIGAYISNTGELVYDASNHTRTYTRRQITTDFVELDPNETRLTTQFRVFAKANNPVASQLAFYDENQTYISRAQYSQTFEKDGWHEWFARGTNIPSGAKYIRASFTSYLNGKIQYFYKTPPKIVDWGSIDTIPNQDYISNQMTNDGGSKLVIGALGAKAIDRSIGPKGIIVNTANKTVTIPADTMFLSDIGPRSYRPTGSTTEPVVIDYRDILDTSSLIKFIYNPLTGEMYPKPYNEATEHGEVIFATLRDYDKSAASWAPENKSFVSMFPYYIDGKYLNIPEQETNPPVFIEKSMIAVAHRGYSKTAPENTLPAYQLAKTMGFDYAECDVSITSDGVPVLLHDATINRTARNPDGSELADTIKIKNITYQELLQYDFGIWKSQDYAGTQIPTFEEFMRLCKYIKLTPVIELKASGQYTDADFANMVQIVHKAGMTNKIIWISFDNTYLLRIAQLDPISMIWQVSNAVNNTVITNTLNLKTPTNQVWLDTSTKTQAAADLCAANNLPMAVWSLNSEEAILSLPTYVSGVTSDFINAETLFYDTYIR